MKSIYKTLLVLLLSCCQYYMAAAQDRTNAYGYQFTTEELAQYPQKTNLPTVYLDVYKTTVDPETGKTSLTLDGGNPQLEDYTTVFGTKNDWYYITQIIIRDDNGTIEERNETTNLRGRGNSTWDIYGSYKKGLRLKFPAKTALLGSGHANAKSWTLLANHLDPSLIRNALANELGQMIGMPFCPAYKFVDLVVCGQYMGTYQISDQVQVAKDRVNINEKTGYFVEMVGADKFLEDPYITAGKVGVKMNIKSPDPDVTTASGESTDPKYAALKTWMGRAADLAQSWTYKSPVSWRKYVDTEAAARAMIGMDITGNYDGAKGNNYAYMNDLESKLFYGPLWDLDLAWGGYSDMTQKHFWEAEHSALKTLYDQVLKNDPYFVKALYEKWQQIYDNGNLITALQGKVTELKELVSQSAEKNFKSTAEGGAGEPLGVDWVRQYSSLNETYEVINSFISTHIAWLNTEYSTLYNNLGCASLPSLSENGVGLFHESTQNGSTVYTFVAAANQVREGAVLTVNIEGGSSPYFSAKTLNSTFINWGAPNENGVYTKTLTAEEAEMLRANDNAFRLEVGNSGTCSSVTLVAPPCNEHNYTNCEYAKQENGTYRRMCTVCSEVETAGEVYYQFTVYPESATPNDPIYATSWTPDSEHPNSVASIEVTLGAEPTGYNIINTTKNADKEKTCADFRLTDGHPYFSDDAFVAATASYSRNVSNTWGTMVLPFKQQNAVTATASYYHLKSVSGTGPEQTFVLTPIQPEIEDNASAFVPVFFRRANDDVSTVSVSATNVKVKKSNSKTNMTSSLVDGWTLKGVMQRTVFNVSSGQADAGRNLYYISNNKFYHATGTLTMNPFRAYMEYTSSEPAAARFNLIVDDDSQSTAISKITADAVIVCVEQGGLRIEGAAGTSVRVSSVGGTLLLDTVLPDNKTLFIPLQSGVYIVNGNKVVVK